MVGILSVGSEPSKRALVSSGWTSQLRRPDSYSLILKMTGITRNVQLFVNSIVDLMKVNDISQDKIDQMHPKLEEICNDFTQRLDKVDKELSEHKDLISALMRKISALEKVVKLNTMSERRRDYNQVRNNLIARTQKSVTEVQKFISTVVEQGGGGKITQKSIPVIEIQPPSTRQREQKIYRVILGEGQKKAVFSGISKVMASVDPGVHFVHDIRIDNECPKFLLKTKRDMERISYSIRSKFKDSHGVRVKVVLAGLKLRIKCKDRETPEWYGLDDIKAHDYSSIDVFYGADELPAGGAQKVCDLYRSLITALE